MSGTILVTGGTGLLGEGLRGTAPPGWSLVSTHLRPYPPAEPGVIERRVDVRDRSALAALFSEFRFDAVVHAAGIASVDYSERHEAESRESNIGGTRNVAELCQAHGIRLVYVSTNAVFDGRHAPYAETDPANPVNTYGRIKLECEHLVQRTAARSVIARPILMYGWPHAMGRPNPVTWVIDALERGQTIHVVDDVYENPLYNITAAQALWAIVRTEIAGVVHLAGDDVFNRYEFALAVARHFNLDARHIRPVPSSYFPDIAPRPPNTTLVTTRMEKELGVAPSTLDEGLSLMAEKRRARA
jgi:dTDP-4-dehydrorhamnose reductase